MRGGDTTYKNSVFPIQKAGGWGGGGLKKWINGQTWTCKYTLCGHVCMDVAPKWFHFYHFLHRLGLLIQSSLLSSTVGLVVLVKIVFLKNIFSSDFDGSI